jgi:CBS domain-containing protein
MSLQRFCKRPIVAIAPEKTISEACQLLEERNVGCLLVEEHGQLCGMLTDRDIALRLTGRGKDLQLTRVGMVMTANPVRISVDSTLHQLTMIMHSQHVRRVPIIDENGRTLGIVTLDDLLVLLGDEMSDLASTVKEAFFRKPADVEAEDYRWWASYS